MKLISEEIIEEDGQKYKVETYDNGAVVKSAWSDEPMPEPEPVEPEEPDPTQLDNIEESLADLALNQVEIIKTLNER